LVVGRPLKMMMWLTDGLEMAASKGGEMPAPTGGPKTSTQEGGETSETTLACGPMLKRVSE
jgi:hypothetical protein